MNWKLNRILSLVVGAINMVVCYKARNYFGTNIFGDQHNLPDLYYFSQQGLNPLGPEWSILCVILIWLTTSSANDDVDVRDEIARVVGLFILWLFLFAPEAIILLVWLSSFVPKC
ncbi:MAG: hypothetical protein V2A77_05480 [Pseudomonadota bacterium]